MDHSERQEEIIDEAVKESRAPRGRRLLKYLIVAVAASLITGLVAAWIVYDRTKQDAESGVSLAEEVRQSCKIPRERTEQQKAVCEEARKVLDESSTPVKGDPGDPGPEGPPPSDEQVSKAVALYCSTGVCKGQNGNSATPAQVGAAVALYCNQRGQCRGPAGKAGDAGADGADGSNATDDQVQSAVNSYCNSRNNCEGPRGPEGPAGPPGADGDNGQTGVIDVNSNCNAPDGQTIDEVNAAYNADSRTIVITCTYKDDATVLN